MAIRSLAVVGLLFFASNALWGEDVEGRIIVKRKLTKSRVTASLPMYQRGTVVELAPDSLLDALSLERARTVVYLEGRHASRSTTASLEQVNRRFSQDTLVIPAGSAITFPNGDPIFHNVFSLSKTKSFDLGNYAKGDTRSVRFDDPGVVFVNCHLHPNMTAAIVVAPNQWNARADGDGHFVLRDVAPGDYVAVAWHKAAGFLRKPLKVTAGKTASLEFLVPLDDAPVKGR